MTALEFGIGIGIILVLFSVFVYMHTKMDIEEKKAIALKEAQDDQKIKSDVHGLSDDELREIIRLRGKPKA